MLTVWLGEKFAAHSSVVLQLLIVGVLLNSVAQVPFTFLQGIGRPDIPAKINLIELPFYVALMWFAVKEFGINGAALIWIMLNIVNTGIQIFIVYKLVQANVASKSITLFSLVVVCALVVPFLLNDILLKIFFVTGTLFILVLVTWKYLFHAGEKLFLISALKRPAAYFIKEQ